MDFSGSGGFNSVVLSTTDPFLLATTTVAYDPILTTGAAALYGSAQTPTLTVPVGVTNLSLWVQPVMLGPTIFPTGAPNFFRIP